MALFDEIRGESAQRACGFARAADAELSGADQIWSTYVGSVGRSEVALLGEHADAALVRVHETVVDRLARSLGGSWHTLWQIDGPPGLDRMSLAARNEAMTQFDADRRAVGRLMTHFRAYIADLGFSQFSEAERPFCGAQTPLRESGVVVGADGSRHRFALVRVRSTSNEPLAFWERYGFRYPSDTHVYMQLLEKSLPPGSDQSPFTIRILMSPDAFNFELRELRLRFRDYSGQALAYSGVSEEGGGSPNIRPWAWNVLLTALAHRIERRDGSRTVLPYLHGEQVRYDALEQDLQIQSLAPTPYRFRIAGNDRLAGSSNDSRGWLPFQAAADIGLPTERGLNTFRVVTNFGTFFVAFHYNPSSGDVNYQCELRPSRTSR
ncbi:MAG: hypothetical protein K1X79_07185 [Oligoflexia bacterium]|nr:hypothetical protein [Oligoflexia bacterium]